MPGGNEIARTVTVQSGGVWVTAVVTVEADYKWSLLPLLIASVIEPHKGEIWLQFSVYVYSLVNGSPFRWCGQLSFEYFGVF